MTLIEEIKKLSDDWFEHDSGDGFGRSTDEEIEHIAKFVAKKLKSQRKAMIRDLRMEKLKVPNNNLDVADAVAVGYNQAVSEINQAITKLEEKL